MKNFLKINVILISILMLLLYSCKKDEGDLNKYADYNPEDDMPHWNNSEQVFSDNIWNLNILQILTDNNNSPHIIYEDNHGGAEIYHIWKDESDTWQSDNVKDILYYDISYGTALIDSQNVVHIFADRHYWKDNSGTWQNELLPDQIQNAQFADIDSKGDLHIVAYYQNAYVYYGYKEDSAWQYHMVDDVGVWSGICAISIDNNDIPNIVYSKSYNINNTSGLNYAYFPEGDTIPVLKWINGYELSNELSIGAYDTNNVHITFKDASMHAFQYSTNQSGYWESTDPVVENAERSATNPYYGNYMESPGFTYTNGFGSLETSSNGTVHFAYIHTPVENLPFVKYSYKLKGTDSYTQEVVHETDVTVSPGNIKICIDNNNTPHIAFIRSETNGDQFLMYAVKP